MANSSAKDGPVTLTIVLKFGNMKCYQAFQEESARCLTDFGSIESALLTGLPPVLDVADQLSK